VTDLEAFIDDLEPVTDLGLVRADIVFTAKGTPFAFTAGANRDVGATFSGLVYEGNGKKASHKLPGIKMALVEVDGSVLPDNVTVAPYLAHWVESTPHDLLISDGETIASWLKGSLDE